MKKIPIFSIFAFSLLSSICFSATIHIPADYPTIQEGIDSAENGDVVLVAPGTYVENLFYHGKVITVKSSHGPETTIIDGNSTGSVVAFVESEDFTSKLEGFTLTNGSGTHGLLMPGVYAYFGGGVYCYDSSPTIKNNIISNNNAIYYGGGIALRFSSAVIRQNQILNNGHGGIYMIENSSPIISGNLIDGNSSPAGAGLQIGQSSPVIDNNQISGNTATLGGAAYCSESNVWFLRNLISGNSGFSTGGVKCSQSTTSVFMNNYFIGNTASKFAGALSCFTDTHTSLINNVFADNVVTEGDGGAIACGGESEVILTGNTIVGNSARLDGGGLYCTSENTLIITNSIFWDNHAGRGDQISVVSTAFPSTVYINSSVVEDGQAEIFVEPNCTLVWGVGMIDSDPCFVDSDTGDFHLTFNSPCRGSGDNFAPEMGEFDIDGNSRIVYGTVDIGADEFADYFYITGDSTPGGSIEGKIVGLPGTSPVGLFVGSGVLDPPMQHVWGNFYLEAPWYLYPLVPVPSNGVLVIPVTIPLLPAAPYELPMQALIGNNLSNLFVLEVQ